MTMLVVGSSSPNNNNKKSNVPKSIAVPETQSHTHSHTAVLNGRDTWTYWCSTTAQFRFTFCPTPQQIMVLATVPLMGCSEWCCVHITSTLHTPESCTGWPSDALYMLLWMASSICTEHLVNNGSRLRNTLDLSLVYSMNLVPLKSTDSYCCFRPATTWQRRWEGVWVSTEADPHYDLIMTDRCGISQKKKICSNLKKSFWGKKS